MALAREHGIVVGRWSLVVRLCIQFSNGECLKDAFGRDGDARKHKLAEFGDGILCMSLLAATCSAQTGIPGGSGSAFRETPLAFRRAEKLKHGINASEWFAQVYDKRGYTPEHFQAWTTAEDIALIKSMGFDHVRLSVNPQPMFSSREPNKIPAEYLASLDAAVKMILDQGLAVVIDLIRIAISRRGWGRRMNLSSVAPISGGRWLHIIRPGTPTACFLKL